MNICTEQAKKAANENPIVKKLLDEGWQKVGFHEYPDEDGNPLYWRIRLDHPNNSNDSKWVRPLSFDGNNWVLKEPRFAKGKKPLYLLPFIKNAVDDVIYVVEGEKCADMLLKCGISVTTSGSAASASEADWSVLTGKQVIIWRDNDDAGLKYAQAVTEQLAKINCTPQWVDVVQLNIKLKGDCVDWLASNPNATAEEIKSLPLITPPSETLSSKNYSPHYSTEPSLDIIPLCNEHEQIIPYPVDLLPELAQKAVTAYQAYGQQPPSMVAASAVASMSLACQGLANIERDKQLTSPISLYLIVVAESGERKTAADNFFSAPLKTWETNEKDILEVAIKEVKSKLQIHTAKKDALITKIKNETAKDRSTLKLENDLQTLELNEPKRIITPKLFHEEVTPEALSFSVASGWQSSSLWSDEAGIVIGGQGMNQDNILKAITLLNRLWDGNKYSVDRKTSDNFTIEGRRFTCSLMMQYSVFEQFINRCGGISRGSGFLSRCLIVMPISTMGTRLYKEPSHIVQTEPFNARISQLLDIPLPLDQKGRLTPKILQFSLEAKKIWIEFHNDIEKQLKIGGEYENIRDFAAKAAENTARLAGIFHVFEKGTEELIISQDMLKRAAGVITWHLRETNRIIEKQSIPQEIQDAQKFVDWIIANNITEYKIADLLRYAPRRFRKKDRRDKTLVILDEHNCLKITDKTFISNPKLWSNSDV